MILIINPGSSSLKFKLYDDEVKETLQGDDITIDGSMVSDHAQACEKMFLDIGSKISSIAKVGVRVVHGGKKYNKPTIINEDVISEIDKYSQFAPIHNPLALEIIKFLQQKSFSNIYAVFDTEYFIDMPEESFTYALPKIEGDIEVRRYGFHGISHSYAQREADRDNSKKVISVHLGAGCSITAISCGKVVKTSMGMTPLEGLVMQTRSGDLDPGVVFYLTEKLGIENAYELIKKKAGLAGLTGTGGSMLEVLAMAGERIEGVDYQPIHKPSEDSKKNAELALRIYINKIKEYIGAYSALMNGVDVVVFTGKIGAGSEAIRNKVMNNMDFFGDVLIKVVEPNEELAMAREIKNFE